MITAYTISKRWSVTAEYSRQLIFDFYLCLPFLPDTQGTSPRVRTAGAAVSSMMSYNPRSRFPRSFVVTRAACSDPCRPR